MKKPPYDYKTRLQFIRDGFHLTFLGRAEVYIVPTKQGKFHVHRLGFYYNWIDHKVVYDKSIHDISETLDFKTALQQFSFHCGLVLQDGFKNLDEILISDNELFKDALRHIYF